MTKRQHDKKTKRKKTRNKRLRQKREFYIVMSGQFRTLAMFLKDIKIQQRATFILNMYKHEIGPDWSTIALGGLSI